MKKDYETISSKWSNSYSVRRLQMDNATYDIDYNPNGSFYAVEGITSADGRILGKMGHSERIGKCTL